MHLIGDGMCVCGGELTHSIGDGLCAFVVESEGTRLDDCMCVYLWWRMNALDWRWCMCVCLWWRVNALDWRWYVYACVRASVCVEPPLYVAL